MKKMMMLMKEEEMVGGKVDWVLVGRRDGRRRVLVMSLVAGSGETEVRLRLLEDMGFD